MPMARVTSALVVGLLGAASLGPRLDPDPGTPPSRLPDAIYRCTSVTDAAWSPLPGLEYTGRLSAQVPAGTGALVFVMGDTVPLDVVAETAGGASAMMRVERLRTGGGTPAPPAYWLEYGDPWAAPPSILRATLDATPDRAQHVTLRLGRRAPRIIARLRGYEPHVEAVVCAIALGVEQAFVGTDRLMVTPADERYFGAGWYGEEPSAQSGTVRWMREHGAVLIPSAMGGAMRLRLDAIAAVATTLTVVVNDVFTTAPIEMEEGLRSYEWDVPARAWLAGTNELFFTVSRTGPAPRDTRMLGLALARLEMHRSTSLSQ